MQDKPIDEGAASAANEAAQDPEPVAKATAAQQRAAAKAQGNATASEKLAPTAGFERIAPRPTVGRTVHYWSTRWKGQPLAAIITAVHADKSVGLKVFGPDGSHEHHDGVHVMPEGKIADSGVLNGVWTWPPRV